jgi:hypothetical protein
MSNDVIRAKGTKRTLELISGAVAGIALCLGTVVPASAGTLYWDNNGGTGNGLGTIAAPATLTWNTTVSNTTWNPTSDGSGTASAWVNGNQDDANFTIVPSPAGTVTVNLSTGITAKSLTFGTGATDYTFTGSVLTLAGGTGIIDSGPSTNSQTLTLNLGGSTGLTKNGTGKLTLTLGGIYTGTTTVNSGTLKTTLDIIPNSSDLVVNANGTFETGITSNSEFVNSLSGTGTITSSAATSYLAISGNSSTTFDGVLTGNGRSHQVGQRHTGSSGERCQHQRGKSVHDDDPSERRDPRIQQDRRECRRRRGGPQRWNGPPRSIQPDCRYHDRQLGSQRRPRRRGRSISKETTKRSLR